MKKNHKKIIIEQIESTFIEGERTFSNLENNMSLFFGSKKMSLFPMELINEISYVKKISIDLEDEENKELFSKIITGWLMFPLSVKEENITSLDETQEVTIDFETLSSPFETVQFKRMIIVLRKLLLFINKNFDLDMKEPTLGVNDLGIAIFIAGIDEDFAKESFRKSGIELRISKRDSMEKYIDQLIPNTPQFNTVWTSLIKTLNKTGNCSR